MFWGFLLSLSKCFMHVYVLSNCFLYRNLADRIYQERNTTQVSAAVSSYSITPARSVTMATSGHVQYPAHPPRWLTNVKLSAKRTEMCCLRTVLNWCSPALSRSFLSSPLSPLTLPLPPPFPPLSSSPSLLLPLPPSPPSLVTSFVPCSPMTSVQTKGHAQLLSAARLRWACTLINKKTN